MTGPHHGVRVAKRSLSSPCSSAQRRPPPPLPRCFCPASESLTEMSSDPLHSSQDFVRALKAAVDPPVSGGPPKIDIALKAWNDNSFYVPSKAEIIADWLLTKLLKEKGKERCVLGQKFRLMNIKQVHDPSSANPIFDIRFWRLLSSVTERQGSTAKGLNLRTNKPWLANLLHRVPLGPVVVAVLSSFDDIATNDGLHSTIASCLSGLWPLSVQRMNVELVQSSFGAFISCVFKEISNPEMVQLGKTISASYRDSLTNSTQKKKARRVQLLDSCLFINFFCPYSYTNCFFNLTCATGFSAFQQPRQRHHQHLKC